jgi:hypothetical protein
MANTSVLTGSQNNGSLNGKAVTLPEPGLPSRSKVPKDDVAKFNDAIKTDRERTRAEDSATGALLAAMEAAKKTNLETDTDKLGRDMNLPPSERSASRGPGVKYSEALDFLSTRDEELRATPLPKPLSYGKWDPKVVGAQDEVPGRPGKPLAPASPVSTKERDRNRTADWLYGAQVETQLGENGVTSTLRTPPQEAKTALAIIDAVNDKQYEEAKKAQVEASKDPYLDDPELSTPLVPLVNPSTTTKK